MGTACCECKCKQDAEFRTEESLDPQLELHEQKPQDLQEETVVEHTEKPKTPVTEPSEHFDFSIFLAQLNAVSSPSPIVNEVANQLGKFHYDPPQSTLGHTFKDELTADGRFIGFFLTLTKERDGAGVLIKSDGSRFDGYWTRNREHGKGRLIYADGSVYNGRWHEGKASGTGTFTDKEGYKYEGEWKDGEKEGHGREFSPQDKAVYMGNFQAGKRHGLGQLEVPGLLEYEGEFAAGNFHGRGRCVWNDGKTYEGDWEDGCMHGSGKVTWPDGRSYIGTHAHSQKQGHGLFEWPDGRKYDGEWFAGKQHGKGTFVSASGVKREAEWANGKRVRWLQDMDSESITTAGMMNASIGGDRSYRLPLGH